MGKAITAHVFLSPLVNMLSDKDSSNVSVKTEELVSIHLVPLAVDEETPDGKTKKTSEPGRLGVMFSEVLISP